MPPLARRLPAVLLTGVALIALALAAILAVRARAIARAPLATTTWPTAPDPALKPAEVVAAVLAALRDDHAPDDPGLRTAFRFASPANQAVTGPVDRFVAMVRRPPYDVLVHHASARVRPVDVTPGAAVIWVTVRGRDGTASHFLWYLSKQIGGPHPECWMTDGVSPVHPPELDPDRRQRFRPATRPRRGDDDGTGKPAGLPVPQTS